jgi:hypothetical protein
MNQQIELDAQKSHRYMEDLRQKQRLGSGILSGIAAAAIGAVGWGAFTYLTNYKLGAMAVAVGALVGFAVRKFGRGIDIQFRILAALLALLGCLAGNLLVVCIIIAHQGGFSVLGVISALTPASAIKWLQVTFDPMDIIFYGIAVYEGFKLAVRRLTQENYAKIANMP